MRASKGRSTLWACTALAGLWTWTTAAQNAEAGATSNAGAAVGVELVAEGLTAPLTLAEFPDDSGRLLVLEQVGRLRVIDADGKLSEEPFLDFQDRLDPTIEPGFDERGALGFAFHPDYAENGKLYVYYSAPLRQGHDLQNEEWGTHTSHIAEIQVSEDDPDKADPDHERLVLQVDQPQFAHNAGTLAFGPKGMLHIALGDGGSAPENGDYPREGTSQMPDDLLGKILRIDVDQVNGAAYGIPEDNPFVAWTAIAARSTPWVFAIPTRSLSTPMAPGGFSSAMSARTPTRKSISWCPAGTMAGRSRRRPIASTGTISRAISRVATIRG